MIGPIRLSDEAKAGKCRERVGSPDGSHLSPDGGSLSRAAVHRLAADGYDSAAIANQDRASDARDEKNPEKANTVCKKTEGGVTSVQRLLIRRGKIDLWNLSNTIRATRLRVPAQSMGRTKESKNIVMFPSPTDTRASLIFRLRDWRIVSLNHDP